MVAPKQSQCRSRWALSLLVLLCGRYSLVPPSASAPCYIYMLPRSDCVRRATRPRSPPAVAGSQFTPCCFSPSPHSVCGVLPGLGRLPLPRVHTLLLLSVSSQCVRRATRSGSPSTAAGSHPAASLCLLTVCAACYPVWVAFYCRWLQFTPCCFSPSPRRATRSGSSPAAAGSRPAAPLLLLTVCAACYPFWVAFYCRWFTVHTLLLLSVSLQCVWRATRSGSPSTAAGSHRAASLLLTVCAACYPVWVVSYCRGFTPCCSSPSHSVCGVLPGLGRLLLPLVHSSHPAASLRLLTVCAACYPVWVAFYCRWFTVHTLLLLSFSQCVRRATRSGSPSTAAGSQFTPCCFSPSPHSVCGVLPGLGRLLLPLVHSSHPAAFLRLLTVYASCYPVWVAFYCRWFTVHTLLLLSFSQCVRRATRSGSPSTAAGSQFTPCCFSPSPHSVCGVLPGLGHLLLPLVHSSHPAASLRLLTACAACYPVWVAFHCRGFTPCCFSLSPHSVCGVYPVWVTFYCRWLQFTPCCFSPSPHSVCGVLPGLGRLLLPRVHPLLLLSLFSQCVRLATLSGSPSTAADSQFTPCCFSLSPHSVCGVLPGLGRLPLPLVHTVLLLFFSQCVRRATQSGSFPTAAGSHPAAPLLLTVCAACYPVWVAFYCRWFTVHTLLLLSVSSQCVRRATRSGSPSTAAGSQFTPCCFSPHSVCGVLLGLGRLLLPLDRSSHPAAALRLLTVRAACYPVWVAFYCRWLTVHTLLLFSVSSQCMRRATRSGSPSTAAGSQFTPCCFSPSPHSVCGVLPGLGRLLLPLVHSSHPAASLLLTVYVACYSVWVAFYCRWIAVHTLLLLSVSSQCVRRATPSGSPFAAAGSQFTPCCFSPSPHSVCGVLPGLGRFLLPRVHTLLLLSFSSQCARRATRPGSSPAAAGSQFTPCCFSPSPHSVCGVLPGLGRLSLPLVRSSHPAASLGLLTVCAACYPVWVAFYCRGFTPCCFSRSPHTVCGVLPGLGRPSLPLVRSSHPAASLLLLTACAACYPVWVAFFCRWFTVHTLLLLSVSSQCVRRATRPGSSPAAAGSQFTPCCFSPSPHSVCGVLPGLDRLLLPLVHSSHPAASFRLLTVCAACYSVWVAFHCRWFTPCCFSPSHSVCGVLSGLGRLLLSRVHTLLLLSFSQCVRRTTRSGSPSTAAGSQFTPCCFSPPHSVCGVLPGLGRLSLPLVRLSHPAASLRLLTVCAACYPVWVAFRCRWFAVHTLLLLSASSQCGRRATRSGSFPAAVGSHPAASLLLIVCAACYPVWVALHCRWFTPCCFSPPPHSVCGVLPGLGRLLLPRVHTLLLLSVSGAALVSLTAAVIDARHYHVVDPIAGLCLAACLVGTMYPLCVNVGRSLLQVSGRGLTSAGFRLTHELELNLTHLRLQ